MAKMILDMEPMKNTDNTVVFAERKSDKPLSVRRISGLYINNRDLVDLGWTGKSLKLTIEAE
jgi:hypothetical protein